MGLKSNLKKANTIKKGVCTELTVKDIQASLASYFGIRNNIIVPNVSWGMLDYEADLLIMNKTGYVTEIEIKRSWSDFWRILRKMNMHIRRRLSISFGIVFQMKYIVNVKKS